MYFPNHGPKLVLCLASALLLSACVGGKTVKPSAAVDKNKELALKQDDSKAATALKAAREKVALGKEEELARYSPKHFASANKLKAEMEGDYSKFIAGTKSLFGSVKESDLVALSKKINKEIDQGLKVKVLVQTHLKEQLEQKAFIDGMVTKAYSREYGHINDDLNDLIKDIEDKKSFSGLEKARTKLSINMHKLEVDIAYDRYVKEVKARLTALKKEDIPSSHVKAELAIQLLENHLKSKPRDTAVLERLQDRAIKDTDLATVIMNEVTRLRATDKKDHESFILSYYKIINDNINPLVEEDFYHIALERQVQKYAQLIRQRLEAAAKQSSSSDSEQQQAIAAALAEQRQRFDEERAALRVKLNQRQMEVKPAAAPMGGTTQQPVTPEADADKADEASDEQQPQEAPVSGQATPADEVMATAKSEAETAESDTGNAQPLAEEIKNPS